MEGLLSMFIDFSFYKLKKFYKVYYINKQLKGTLYMFNNLYVYTLSKDFLFFLEYKMMTKQKMIKSMEILIF